MSDISFLILLFHHFSSFLFLPPFLYSHFLIPLLLSHTFCHTSSFSYTPLLTLLFSNSLFIIFRLKLFFHFSVTETYERVLCDMQCDVRAHCDMDH